MALMMTQIKHLQTSKQSSFVNLSQNVDSNGVVTYHKILRLHIHIVCCMHHTVYCKSLEVEKVRGWKRWM